MGEKDIWCLKETFDKKEQIITWEDAQMIVRKMQIITEWVCDNKMAELVALSTSSSMDI